MRLASCLIDPSCSTKEADFNQPVTKKAKWESERASRRAPSLSCSFEPYGCNEGAKACQQLFGSLLSRVFFFCIMKKMEMKLQMFVKIFPTVLHYGTKRFTRRRRGKCLSTKSRQFCIMKKKISLGFIFSGFLISLKAFLNRKIRICRKGRKVSHFQDRMEMAKSWQVSQNSL